MTGPVWDGSGVDPWLPERLARLHELAEAERRVYEDYFHRLANWLINVLRSVLRGGIPDPNGVWALAPAWAQEMTDFIATTIRDIIGMAYRAFFGDEYDYDSRPHVVTYLATVHNRMVRTPDEVFDLVAGEVAEGAGLGESIPKIADRIQALLSMTETPYWPNRAVVVARTETVGALNAGRSDAYQEIAFDLGGEFEQLWLATDDSRTRLSHREADGQRVPIGTPFSVGGASLLFPGDPTGPPQEVIQCRCTTLLVRPGETVDMSNRQFRDI